MAVKRKQFVILKMAKNSICFHCKFHRIPQKYFCAAESEWILKNRFLIHIELSSILDQA